MGTGRSMAAFCATSSVSLRKKDLFSCTCFSRGSTQFQQPKAWRRTRTVLGAPPAVKGGSKSMFRMQQSGGNQSVPIDAPSGVLLAISSVLAIASVGCVFELAGGHPQYGQSVTTGILVVSLPSFLGLFYAAIRKGQAEAEEE